MPRRDAYGRFDGEYSLDISSSWGSGPIREPCQRVASACVLERPEKMELGVAPNGTIEFQNGGVISAQLNRFRGSCRPSEPPNSYLPCNVHRIDVK